MIPFEDLRSFLGNAHAGAPLLFVAMYSLLQPKDVLKSGTRGRIYAVIADNPGITLVDLACAAGVRHQTACYHVQVLRKAGCVTLRRSGNKTLHFAAGSCVGDADRELFSVGADSATMRVLLEVVRAPGRIRKEVTGALGLTRTSGAWHVKKLLRLGVLRIERHGGRARLFPDEARARRLLGLRGEPATLGVGWDEPTVEPTGWRSESPA